MQMLRVQRPLLWMFNALGILAGTSPSYLATQLVATVDAAQGGWGFPTYDPPVKAYGQVVTGAAGNYTLLSENVDQDEIRLWFCSCVNNEAAGVTVQLKLFREGRYVEIAGGVVIAAGNFSNYAALSGGAHPRWVVVPPGWGVAAFHSAMVGAGLTWNMGVGIFPAGTKPF